VIEQDLEVTFDESGYRSQKRHFSLKRNVHFYSPLVVSSPCDLLLPVDAACIGLALASSTGGDGENVIH
jgi:hypothetical protein